MDIGSWEPYWIGTPTKGKYAALHRPEVVCGPGVLFVPPLLHEMPRSRRFVAEVATCLSRMGLPCFRFDFAGTGDSSGCADDVDLNSLQRDISEAEAKLRSLANVSRIVVLSWRSASFPVHKWLMEQGAQNAVLMWDPVLDGRAWLEQLKQQDRGERKDRTPYLSRSNGAASQSDGQLMGFPVSEQFRNDLAGVVISLKSYRTPASVWGILRTSNASDGWGRVFTLPEDAPEFGGASTIDSTMFLSPTVARVVECLGNALLEEP